MVGIRLLPYSILSVNKSITYNQDKVVVSRYLEGLQNFREVFEKEQEDNDLTINRLQYMLGFYQSPWLTTKDTIKI